MTEEFILGYIPERVKQRCYQKYHVRYKDLTIGGASNQTIISYTDHYFIVDDPEGLVIESDYGIYDSTGDFLFNNVHEHKGEIRISNPNADSKRIKFIQLIIIN